MKKPDLNVVEKFDAKSSADILNAIRDDETTPETYRAVMPYADVNDNTSLTRIGGLVLGDINIRNQFLNALVNRIAMVIIQSKSYVNPWSVFKRGLLEFGDVAEEIFVELARPHGYNPDRAENEVFKRELPDISSYLHSMNYQVFYKTTVNEAQLTKAFLSWDGVIDLIQRIIARLVDSMEYDEFNTMKYLIAYAVIHGYMKVVDTTGLTIEQTIERIKGVSNSMEFMSTAYNPTSVHTYSRKSEQYLFIGAEYSASVDVQVLASAFNMDKVQFLGHQVTFDSLWDLDWARFDEIRKDCPQFFVQQFTDDEIELLKKVNAILVDENFFMIFDNLIAPRQLENPEGLYWNHWLHAWKTFDISLYANQVVFGEVSQGVTAVAVNPPEVTAYKKSAIQFTADVTTTGLTEKSVTWSVDSEFSTISDTGLLSIAGTETKASLTVTATSKFDPTKTGTATVTINS